MMMKRILPTLYFITLFFVTACSAPPVTTTTTTTTTSSSSRTTLTLQIERVEDAVTGKQLTADVWIDGKLIAEDQVTYVYVIPTGELHEIRLKAEGYHDWAVNVRPSGTSNKIFSGPARLNPIVEKSTTSSS